MSHRADAYFDLLAGVWAQGESTLIVEHDIEINDQAIRQAKYCACEWSVSPYRGPGEVVLTRSLGCTRFRSSLMKRLPTFMDEVGLINDSVTLGPRHWARLDCSILSVLMQHGYTPHIHAEVLHHHVYDGHCACGGTHDEAP